MLVLVLHYNLVEQFAILNVSHLDPCQIFVEQPAQLSLRALEGHSWLLYHEILPGT